MSIQLYKIPKFPKFSVSINQWKFKTSSFVPQYLCLMNSQHKEIVNISDCVNQARQTSA